MTAPCRHCAERVVGCHGQCGLYADWRRQLDAARSADLSDAGREADRLRIQWIDRTVRRGRRRR